MKTPVAGSKEFQVRALRESRNARAAGGRGKRKAEVSTSKPIIAPVQASAQSQETIMKKAKAKKSTGPKRSVSEAAANLRAAKKGVARKASAPKTKPKAKTSASANARTKVAGESAGVRPGSKLAIVAALLQRPEGCTGAEILEATKWPTCSVPQQAKAAGLILTKEKDGKVTRYRGSVPPVA